MNDRERLGLAPHQDLPRRGSRRRWLVENLGLWYPPRPRKPRKEQGQLPLEAPVNALRSRVTTKRDQ